MLRYTKYSRVKNTTWLCRMKGRKRHGWVSYLLSPSALEEYITACCLSAINWCWNPAHGVLSDHIHYVLLPWKESVTHISLNGTSYHFQLEFLFTCRRILQLFVCLSFKLSDLRSPIVFRNLWKSSKKQLLMSHVQAFFTWMKNFFTWAAGLSIISTHLSTSSTTHFS